MLWEFHKYEEDITLPRKEHFSVCYKLLSEYSHAVKVVGDEVYLHNKQVPYCSAREVCKWVKENAGFTTPNIELLIRKYKEYMPSHGKAVHKEECRLYKAIAQVFEGRIDLSDKQKNELIHLCYDAAKVEEKVAVDCAVSEALSARHEHVPFHHQSFGRRCP